MTRSLRALVLIFGGMAVSNVMAADGPASFFGDGSTELCFASRFSEAELAALPRQVVRTFYVSYRPQDQTPGVPDTLITVGVIFRSSAVGDSSVPAYCGSKGEALGCGVDGGGGTFTLEPKGENSLEIRMTRGIEFPTQSSGMIDLQASGDTVFVLKRLALSECRKIE